MKDLRYFSTFTGIGGLDMGLEKAGAQCVGFSEIRNSSIDIYKRHYPGHENFGDITKIDPKRIPDFDVFTGGFPCQSFSVAGLHKGFGDRRGQMIFYIYDILMEKRPEFAVLENVKGITMHDEGRTYRNVMRLLSSAGYHVRVVLLNSAHYGSAQARERLLFLCSRSTDFPAKEPERRDDTRRFRDFRTPHGPKDVVSERTLARLHKRAAMGVHKKFHDAFETIGGYDRVPTLTTGASSNGHRTLVTWEDECGWRTLTTTEGERLQGFPDGWTDGARRADRWFAIGNAVNCSVSDYLFNDYLKGLWW